MAEKKFWHPDADTKHQIAVRAGDEGAYESQGWLEVGADKDDDKS